MPPTHRPDNRYEYRIQNRCDERTRSRSVVSGATRAELRGLLEQKLDQLPYAFRIVFVLRSVEELSVDETASCLGIPEATVRSRHFRAKNLLRKALAREVDLAERDVLEFGGGDCDRLVAAVMRRLTSESER